ncbi:MAG TPA: YbjN domain-containing protein [Anaerolineae bacterium]|nr:YbjN domain-containing protein [Anaerolineae bacterium]HOR00885.1 YbjN domain-containing protein [Anaerolineae bacterium]HPL30395.1 YbjN domain-containing protein [Anaerolineae bacterium]
MEFKTQAQQACYQKIAPWIREIFGEFARARDDRPVFGVVIGTSFTAIAVYPWGEDDSVITTRSYVVTKVELTPDLMRFLLEQNDRMRFGAFGIDSDGDIFFEHAIVGSTCDKNELQASAIAVAMTSDQYDEQITSRWGGQRACDR